MYSDLTYDTFYITSLNFLLNYFFYLYQYDVFVMLFFLRSPDNKSSIINLDYSTTLLSQVNHLVIL